MERDQALWRFAGCVDEVEQGACFGSDEDESALAGGDGRESACELAGGRGTTGSLVGAAAKPLEVILGNREPAAAQVKLDHSTPKRLAEEAGRGVRLPTSRVGRGGPAGGRPW